jgi:hypothetical protein
MDLKMKEPEKIELEKVEATEEEKSYWSGLLDQEAQAREKLEALEAAKTKITQLKEKTREEIVQAEKTLADRLLAWTLARPWKSRGKLSPRDVIHSVSATRISVSCLFHFLPALTTQIHSVSLRE